MGSAQQQVRRQQRVDELCAAAIRALTGDRALHYRGGRLHRNTVPLSFSAPHLRDHPTLEGSVDFASQRGVIDAISLRLQHSDARLHRRLRPEDPVERLIFELLEQLRVESLAPVCMTGMTANLQHHFEQWSQAFHSSRLTETRLGLLMYTLTQSCWSLLNGRPPMAATETIIETTRAKLVRPLGATMAGMVRHRREQAVYAGYALKIARVVGAMVCDAERQQANERRDRDQDERPPGFVLWLDFEQEGRDEEAAVAESSHSKAVATAQSGSEPGYRAFTTRYDREVRASSLVRAVLLREYREQLNQRIAAQGINLTHLSRQLSALLATTPQRDGWSFEQEEGYIDGRRLAQLVGSPTERRLFRLERRTPVADCVVGFLIDCSGSMKEVIEPVAMIIDVLVRALERCGAASEVLGFTTGALNGGRAYQDWLSAGRPQHPGRLAEVVHILFKDADHDWRRSRATIAALLKTDLFREGIDGEAVDWACNRLLARAEARRILMVVSDGCPMDTATNRVNGESYLNNHLKDVVARREREHAVEVFAIGVGLDLSPVYSHCLATDLSQPIDNDLFFEIVHLLGGRSRR